MPDSHVTEPDVRLFVTGRLKTAALRSFLRHTRRCAACRLRLSPYLPMLDMEEPVPSEAPHEVMAEYDAVLDRAEAGLGNQLAFWSEEKAQLQRLIERAHERRYEGSVDIFSDLAEETHGWAWIEGILALSFELRYRDPEQMRFLLWSASKAVRRIGSSEIDRGRYSPEQLADLQARVLIELANAERLNHSYDEAEEALEQATEALEEGTGDPMLGGRLFDIQASLLIDQRHVAEALELLGHLHRHYLALGERHLAGRTLISKGGAFLCDGRPREAIDVLEEGLRAIDPERDQTLETTGKQTLLNAMVDAGSFTEAGKLLLETGLRQAFAGEPLNLLKLRWVEAKALAGRGKLQRAEEILSEVRDEFLVRDREYLVAMVGLDLAAVHLRRQKPSGAEALAQEALEIFQDLGVEREALRAVRHLRNACRQRTATVALVQRVVRFLNRLEHQPGLRFAV